MSENSKDGTDLEKCDRKVIENLAEAFKADDERHLRFLYPSLFRSSKRSLTPEEENRILEKIRKDFKADDRRRAASLEKNEL